MVSYSLLPNGTVIEKVHFMHTLGSDMLGNASEKSVVGDASSYYIEDDVFGRGHGLIRFERVLGEEQVLNGSLR